MKNKTQEFNQTLRSDLKVMRSGIHGKGRRITVTSQDGRQSYGIDRRNANADTAQLLNSKIPVAVLRPPL